MGTKVPFIGNKFDSSILYNPDSKNMWTFSNAQIINLQAVVSSHLTTFPLVTRCYLNNLLLSKGQWIYFFPKLGFTNFLDFDKFNRDSKYWIQSITNIYH
jgi:hypothetical protein